MVRVSAVFSSGGLVFLFGACVSSTGWWAVIVALSVRGVPELRQPPLRNRRTTFHAAPDDGSRTRDLSRPLFLCGRAAQAVDCGAMSRHEGCAYRRLYGAETETLMKHTPMHTTIAVFVSILAGLLVPAALAQAPLPTPPPLPQTLEGPPSQPALFPPAELDRIVSPIALYPDPLLAQVLAAATFPAEIPEAARWADEHHYLIGMQLTAAIAADRLAWDPSVQALLPFPPGL